MNMLVMDSIANCVFSSTLYRNDHRSMLVTRSLDLIGQNVKVFDPVFIAIFQTADNNYITSFSCLLDYCKPIPKCKNFEITPEFQQPLQIMDRHENHFMTQ